MSRSPARATAPSSALRGDVHTDMGAYMRTNGAVGARNVAQFMAGPYRVPHVKIDSSLWMTNKTPVGTYRGPGRFEADFFLERLLDMVAEDLGIDRVEFRRKNLDHAGGACPIRSPHVQPTDAKDEYDSGDYQETLDRCLKEIDWAEKSKLQGKLIDGRYHGLARRLLHRGRRGRPEGDARGSRSTTTARSRCSWASSSVGQGVETVFAQIAADALEVPIERIRHVYHGSTAYVSDGYGAYHSRSIGDGRLGAARRRQQFPGGAARGGRRSGSAATRPTSRSTRTR